MLQARKRAGWAGVFAATVVLWGCDDAAERQARAEARARAVQAEAAQKATEQALAAAQLAEQQQQAAAQQAAAAEVQARGTLSACCLALARRGFEDRSMQDMDAKQLCLASEGRGETLAALGPALRQALGERQLPPACATTP